MAVTHREVFYGTVLVRYIHAIAGENSYMNHFTSEAVSYCTCTVTTVSELKLPPSQIQNLLKVSAGTSTSVEIEL